MAWGQAPQLISYQAIVRDAANKLVTSQSVGMKISILQGTSTGTSVYTETQTVTTNVNGLVTIEIGNGTVVSGTMASINWLNGPYFVNVEIDPTGGTSYSISATSQLLSVPYALSAGTVTSYFANGYSSGLSPNFTIASSSILNGSVTTILQITGVPAGTYAVYFTCPVSNQTSSTNGINLVWAITANNASALFPADAVANSYIPPSGWALQYPFAQSGYSEVTLTTTGTIELKTAYYGSISGGTVYLEGYYYLRAIKVQ